MSYAAAVIGAGEDPENPSATGYAMGYSHADAYGATENVELVAVADIVPENARAFADTYDIADGGVFEDYHEMLASVEPDVVSVCVPPALHESISVDCIRSGVVEAVHCEKPMADTYGDAKEMTAAADEHDVQLTFNHQRRFSDAVRTAKELLDDGEIGELERVEFAAPVGIFDYGSHSFDLCNYFVDETDGAWVMGQIDYSEENVLFGTHNENQAIVHWEYDNGVHGIGTANSTDTGPTDAIACHNRLLGSDGVIEVGAESADDEADLPPLRIRRDGEDWETVETEDGLHGWAFIDRAIAENVRCLREDERPELCAENALRATELIFATWESSRRRGRVDLPLNIDDNPLQAMLESGDLDPEPADGEAD